MRMGSREAVEKILSQRNHMIEGYEVCHCAHILVSFPDPFDRGLGTRLHTYIPLTKDADIAV